MRFRHDLRVLSSKALVLGGDASVARLLRTFRGEPEQIAHVRKFVREVLASSPSLDEAVLLASELSANAVAHTASGAGGTFDVSIDIRSGVVRVEVRDLGSRLMPVVRPQNGMAEEGRGLGLVSLVADKWGHSGGEDGRSVYFEFHY